jgi:glutaminyl-peptide cyclotransferase
LKTQHIKIFLSILAAGLLALLFYHSNQQTTDNDFSAKDDLILQQILSNAHIPEFHYQIINSYSHPINNFTEGLILRNGILYESIGLYGLSKLIKTDLNTGKILKEYLLPPQYFAEGITIQRDELIQLTYHEHTGFIYDINSFQLKKTFSYQSEGWGLTTNGKQLIMSNGSAALTFINPVTLKPIRSLLVTVNKNNINSLNALQFIDGMIYANIWPTSIIVIISPQNGKVAGWINIKALKPHSSCKECVANGIAYDEKNKVILVTGKNWPYLYAIKLLPTFSRL